MKNKPTKEKKGFVSQFFSPAPAKEAEDKPFEEKDESLEKLVNEVSDNEERLEEIRNEIHNINITINSIPRLLAGCGIQITPFGPFQIINVRVDGTTIVCEDGKISAVGSGRSVKIQAGGVPANNTGPFTCKLLDSNGNETGNAIDVYPREHLGTKNFNSGEVLPTYAAGNYMSVYLDPDGKWYTNTVFVDIGDGLKIVSGVLQLKVDTDQFQFSSGSLQTKLYKCP